MAITNNVPAFNFCGEITHEFEDPWRYPFSVAIDTTETDQPAFKKGVKVKVILVVRKIKLRNRPTVGNAYRSREFRFRPFSLVPAHSCYPSVFVITNIRMS